MANPKSMIFTVPAGSLAGGTYGVVIDNADPLGCPSDPIDVQIVDAPTITDIDPASHCRESDADLVITGTDFFTVDGTLPAVDMDGVALTVTSVDNCVAALGGGQLCTTINATLPANSFKVSGAVDVTVTNPAPAACDGTAVDGFTLTEPRATWTQP